MEIGRPTRFSDYPCYWFLIAVTIACLAWQGLTGWVGMLREDFSKARFKRNMSPEAKRLQHLAGIKE